MAASRLRLTSARDLERRRLVTELDNAITNRLAAIRADISDATDAATAEQTEEALLAVRRAQGRLDELLERFRAIARGVYPSVLRGQGLFSALDELATDLPRPVRFTGTLPERLAWEIEVRYLLPGRRRAVPARRSGRRRAGDRASGARTGSAVRPGRGCQPVGIADPAVRRAGP